MKDICVNCGNEYDTSEWIRCPHCAKKEFRKRHPWVDRIKYYWSKK